MDQTGNFAEASVNMRTSMMLFTADAISLREIQRKRLERE